MSDERDVDSLPSGGHLIIDFGDDEVIIDVQSGEVEEITLVSQWLN